MIKKSHFERVPSPAVLMIFPIWWWWSVQLPDKHRLLWDLSTVPASRDNSLTKSPLRCFYYLQMSQICGNNHCLTQHTLLQLYLLDSPPVPLGGVETQDPPHGGLLGRGQEGGEAEGGEGEQHGRCWRVQSLHCEAPVH